MISLENLKKYPIVAIGIGLIAIATPLVTAAYQFPQTFLGYWLILATAAALYAIGIAAIVVAIFRKPTKK